MAAFCKDFRPGVLSKCGSEDRSKISNFSDVHRSQLFWPALYPCPRLIIVHSILNSNPRSLKDQIFSDSLVLFRYRSRRNDDVCPLYIYLYTKYSDGTF